MSERTLRRAREQRRERAARRAATLRRRATLSATAALGAATLVAGPAQATTFEVTSLADAGAGTLRDAIAQANADTAADTVVFASGLSGTITLTSGPLVVAEDLTITGPGAGQVTVSGDDASRVLELDDVELAVSGLTLADGATTGDGGALLATGAAEIALTDVVVRDSNADGSGAGIAVGDLGGGPSSDEGELVLTRSTVRDNDADDEGGGVVVFGGASIVASTVTGNTTDNTGGGIAQRSKYGAFQLVDSTVSGNSADFAGGLDVFAGFLPAGYGLSAGASAIERSTIAGNIAAGDGGGVTVSGAARDLRVSRSTISGNRALAGQGGGLALPSGLIADVVLDRTTVSSNRSATGGGGIAVGCGCGFPGPGGLVLEGSTVARNSTDVAGAGGGLRLDTQNAPPEQIPPIRMDSSILADNEAAGAPSDTDRDNTAAGGDVDAAFSLIETSGDLPVVDAAPGTNAFGVDPQLGPLADNGGPTQTHRPAGTSPVLDRGEAPARSSVDQRGEARTVDTALPDAAGGDGTDMGSVELAAADVTVPPTPPQPPPSTPPGGTSGQAPSISPAPRDTRAPRSTFRRFAVRPQPITLRGTASSDTEVVRVAVARVTGRRCRFLRASGAFTSPRSCLRTIYVTAEGSTRWRLKLPRLRKGRYFAWSRAVDRAGNVERKVAQRNLTRFAIR